MNKTTFPCVDLKFEGNTIIKQGENRKGVLRFIDDDHFHFTEKAPVVPVNKGQHRQMLARTVHGTFSADEYGFHIGFYIRRDEVNKNEALADLLGTESEEMEDRIVEMEAVC